MMSKWLTTWLPLEVTRNAAAFAASPGEYSCNCNGLLLNKKLRMVRYFSFVKPETLKKLGLKILPE